MSFFDEIFDDIEEMFKKLRSRRVRGVRSGYSISVVYGPDGKPIINVETYGDIDKAALRKEIEKQYPGAEIRGLDEELIREVTEDIKFVDKPHRLKKNKKRDRLGPTEIREVDE